MVKLLDQYDIEPTVFYSGSYVDPIFQGSVLQGNRIVVARHSSGSIELRYANSYANYYELSGSKRNGKLGMAQRYFSFASPTERFYDSLLPDPVEIYTRNTGTIVQASVELGLLENPDLPASKLGKLIFCSQGVTASNIDTSTSIADSEWIGSFPFQRKYSNLKRNLNLLSKQVELPVSEDLVSSIVKYSNTNATGSFGSIEFVLQNVNLKNLVGDSVYEPMRITMMDVRGSVTNEIFSGSSGLVFPPSSNGVYNWDNGTLGPKVSQLTKAIFGFGNFLAGTSVDTSVTSSFFLDAAGGVNSYYATNANISGWKYGLINGFAQYSTCIFRSNKFGQIRDMLEQRKFSKFFNEEDATIKNAVVNIQFVSGSKSFVTASNAFMNVNDSGIYDFEAKSGIPWVDT